METKALAHDDCADRISHEAAFGELYEHGGWGGEKNPGSTLPATGEYRAFIEQFIVEHDITSVLDVGCGEWGFSRLIDWKGARYLGLDIVPAVIERNRAKFPHLEFTRGDARQLEAYPGFDLLILKDVLQHWSNDSIHAFLTQPALAGFRHVLLTNCDDERVVVEDIAEGDWRPLNLLAPQFPDIGLRPIRRMGTKRTVHRGPRIEMGDIFGRFETWIINLDARADRLRHGQNQLARLSVFDARRFPAFDGERLQLASQRSTWLKKGAIGCYLSHIAVLKQAHARRRPCIIIEDDLVLADDFIPEFMSFLKVVPEDWDVILLSGGEHCRPPEVLGPHHARVVGTWGTALAILRLPAIDRLLEHADALDRPIDDFYISMMDTLRFYAPAKKIVWQEWNLGTDIGYD